MNGLMMNGLMMNGLMMNGLPESSLSNNGLDASINTDMNDRLNDAQDGATYNMLFKYIVRCAMPAGSTVTYLDDNNVLWTWTGENGLAPEWQTGALSENQQRAVTSCVLSLTNGLGQNVAVSQRGLSHQVSVEEVQQWNLTEGGFFGNLWQGEMFSCSFSNDYTDPGNGRICTMTDEFGTSLCNPIEALGLCSDICDVETRSEGGENYTVFTNCEAPDGTIYAEVTTTALNI